MQVIKETDKGLLIEKDCVQFWVQRRWLSGYGKEPAREWQLTPAGVKAYAIAARKYKQNYHFNTYEIFTAVRETEKAVLLKCTVELPHNGTVIEEVFWLPKSKTSDWYFVKMKLLDVLNRYPHVGARIKGFDVW